VEARLVGNLVNIIEVEVSIGDSARHSDDEYGRRKAEVTIKGIVPEGVNPEDAIEQVRRYADAKCHEIIHNKPARPVPPAASASATPLTGASSSPEQKSDAATPEGKTKADLEAEAVKAAGGKKASFPKAKGKGKAKKETKPEPDPEDGNKDATITDLDLANAITKKNTDLGKPQAISALLVEFGGRPAPKQVRDIPQEKRLEFLEKLEALS
jgi:hypothetical protein